MEIEFHDRSEWESWFDRLHTDDQMRIVTLLNALEGSRIPLAPPHGRYLRNGLHELRAGSGHRVYYSAAAGVATVLTQGNKSSQQVDIARARRRQ